MRVCVYGASSSALNREFYEAARELGCLLAREGHILIFGGGAKGLMGAVAEGAHEWGGEIIGIAPKFFDLPGILFQNCSRMIFTETMRERKGLMDEMADTFVALPGGSGTYEELFEILTAKQLGLHDRAVVLLNTRHYYDPLEALLHHTVEEHFAGKGLLELYRSCDTPTEVMETVRNYVPQKGSVTEKYNEMRSE